jgi:hypothetical protein
MSTTFDPANQHCNPLVGPLLCSVDPQDLPRAELLDDSVAQGDEEAERQQLDAKNQVRSGGSGARRGRWRSRRRRVDCDGKREALTVAVARSHCGDGRHQRRCCKHQDGH